MNKREVLHGIGIVNQPLQQRTNMERNKKAGYFMGRGVLKCGTSKEHQKQVHSKSMLGLASAVLLVC